MTNIEKASAKDQAIFDVKAAIEKFTQEYTKYVIQTDELPYDEGYIVACIDQMENACQTIIGSFGYIT